MLIELLRWWYGPGWSLAFRRIGERTGNVSHAFSAPTLLQTLFAPWKRITTSGAKGFDAIIQAMIDNMVSRTVGFMVRLMVLIAAVFMLLGTFVMSILIVAIWPFVPVLIIFFVIWGVT
jgi:hypothetical protein